MVNEMATVTKEVKDQVNQQLQATLEKAKVLFQYTGEFPEVEYNITGTCAGRAHCASNKIQFNPVLLMENVEAFLARTVVHELAHIIAYKQYKAKGHDKTWKRVMVMLGASPTRCHSYNIENVANRHLYTCLCSTHQISTVLHNRISKGRVYRCNKCQHPITKVVKNQPVTIKTQLPKYAIAASNKEQTVTTSTQPKQTNKQIVAEIMQANLLKTKEEQVQLIMERLGVTKSNAGVYIYNYY